MPRPSRRTSACASTRRWKPNPCLKGILDKRFGRTRLEPGKLGELVDLVSTIGFGAGHHAKDLLGEVYEYFLGQFASAEGGKGGQFYTPASVVKVLVEVLVPHHGRVYDPACGSGGMFVQSEKFIEAHGDVLANPPFNISDWGGERLTVDWAVRETVRAKLRVMVKTLLKRYKYPPDKQEEATETVLKQAESLSAEWVMA